MNRYFIPKVLAKEIIFLVQENGDLFYVTSEGKKHIASIYTCGCDEYVKEGSWQEISEQKAFSMLKKKENMKKIRINNPPVNTDIYRDENTINSL